jgi:transcriptional regulator PpsR
VPKRPADEFDLGSLSHLAPELAATLAAIASDVALVVDREGIIVSVAHNGNPLSSSTGNWVGRPWADTVTQGTRKKIEQLLDEVSSNGITERREVNVPGASGSEIPMAYAAIRLGPAGPVLAAGRDLRSIAAIQQRFLESQHELERDYWLRRQVESRYHLLQQVAHDAVMLIDAQSMCVLEANRAALDLVGESHASMVGVNFESCIEQRSRAVLEEMFQNARAAGRTLEMRLYFRNRNTPSIVTATPLRGDTEMMMLVRANTRPPGIGAAQGQPAQSDVTSSSDTVVVTDSGGRVVMADAPFLALCGVANETQVRGRSIGDWFEDAHLNLPRILTEVKHRGLAYVAKGSLQVRPGTQLPVEISASLLMDGDQEQIGFTFRPIGTSTAPRASSVTRLIERVERLRVRLGNDSMSDLAREMARLVEDHLIEAALEQAHGDVRAAAQLLGIESSEIRAHLGHAAGSSELDGEDGSPNRLH